jgi:hypothetical protein
VSQRQPAPPPHLEGYSYQRLLGSGGFADVYLYEREMPRMPVAVKVLLTGQLDDRDRERFTQEANVMARFYSHPYIVGILNASVSTDGRPYIVMQYYPRDNLWVRARREPLSVSEALQVGIQIASAVETAHRAGVVHRDIKPANILTSEFGDPGLTDFGISATNEQVADDEGALSIPWSPPEAFDSDAILDERSDIYSLAATVYTFLAGRSPFEVRGGSNSAFELMSRIDRDPLRPIGRSDVPDSLERVLRQGMAKQAEQRHPSALAFARDLQEVEQGLRLKMTTLVVPDDAVEERVHPGDLDDGETRGRAPRRIDPEGPAAMPPIAPGTVRRAPSVGPFAPSAASPQALPGGNLAEPGAGLFPPMPGAGASAARPIEAEELAGTRRRVASGPTPEVTPVGWNPDATPGAAGRPSRRIGRWLALAGATATVLVLMVALLGHSSPSRGASTPSSTTTAPPPVVGAQVPPPTDVAVALSGTSAVATWSHPDPQPGDFFVVLPTFAGVQESPAQTSMPTMTFTAVKLPVCVQVELVSSDGQASAPSAPACSP